MYNGKSAGFSVKSLGACILLLLAAMAWGSGFAIAKRALDTLPPCFILTVRFGIGTLILFSFYGINCVPHPIKPGSLGWWSAYLSQPGTLSSLWECAIPPQANAHSFLRFMSYWCHFWFGQQVDAARLHGILWHPVYVLLASA